VSKRGNGEGSIYLDSRGLYRAAVTVDGGKRRYLSGKTRAEVAEKLTAALDARHKGLPLPGVRLTTERHLMTWLEDTVKDSLKPLTYVAYKHLVDKHIVPAIGKVPLARLEPQHVRRLQKTMAAKGLSAATIHGMRTALSAALSQAERDGLVVRNVVRLVTAPRADDTEPRVLQPEESAGLLDAARGDEFEHLFTTMLATGLRPAEARGLRWSDVQLAAPALKVRQQIVELQAGPIDRTRRCEATTHRGRRCMKSPIAGQPLCALHSGRPKRREAAEPKSRHGRRDVALIPLAISALQAQRRRVAELRLRAGSLWRDHDLVFPGAFGEPLLSRTVQDHFARIAARAGVADATPHTLRHSTGTYLLAAGVPDRVVQAILGHGSAAMTRHYEHVLPAMLTDAGTRLAQFFGAAGS